MAKATQALDAALQQVSATDPDASFLQESEEALAEASAPGAVTYSNEEIMNWLDSKRAAWQAEDAAKHTAA
jgi:hypothetical protein